MQIFVLDIKLKYIFAITKPKVGLCAFVNNQ